MTHTTSPKLLSAAGVSVRFGKVIAVDDVHLQVGHDEKIGIVGPNGAGKTTLFNVVNGLLEPEPGSLTFDGHDITGTSAPRRSRLGISRTFQNLRLFPSLTVLENVLVATRGAGAGLSWTARRRSESEHALSVLSMVEPELYRRRDEIVSKLPYGLQKYVELARAVSSRPRLLLLDEPAAGLNSAERLRLCERLQEMTAGIALLVVEHDLRFTSNLADRLVVMDAGRIIADGPPDVVRRDPGVVEAYLGTRAADAAPTEFNDELALVASSPTGRRESQRRGHPVVMEPPRAARQSAADASVQAGPPILRLVSVEASYGRIRVLHGVSIEVGEGKLVALIGPNGAGKSTTLRTVSGLLRPCGGEIWFDGARIDGRPAHEIAAAGVAHVPEGRRVFGNLSVRENLLVGATRLPKGNTPGEGVDRMLELFPSLRERLNVKAGRLSGGEQQMLAIGRGLMSQPRLLLLDEPSLGLAPKVVDEIFATISGVVALGTTVFLIEQNSSLALETADYAYVLESGQVNFDGDTDSLRHDKAVQDSYLGL